MANPQRLRSSDTAGGGQGARGAGLGEDRCSGSRLCRRASVHTSATTTAPPAISALVSVSGEQVNRQHFPWCTWLPVVIGTGAERLAPSPCRAHSRTGEVRCAPPRSSHTAATIQSKTRASSPQIRLRPRPHQPPRRVRPFICRPRPLPPPRWPLSIPTRIPRTLSITTTAIVPMGKKLNARAMTAQERMVAGGVTGVAAMTAVGHPRAEDAVAANISQIWLARAMQTSGRAAQHRTDAGRGLPRSLRPSAPHHQMARPVTCSSGWE
jgi:hypothetical protein